MEQTQEDVTQNLVEQLCWEAACRRASWVASRLSWKSVVGGVYRLDESPFLDDFLHYLQALGIGGGGEGLRYGE